MAGRQRSTFQKRQKEAKRLEKQRLKREKRAARRLEEAQKRSPATDQETLHGEVTDSETEMAAPEEA
ncbi:MAG: hypothetical protein HYS33_03580 [Acidobacteria bacterium]|nr:hypothetical protein [Acidobacteriota bacterium]